MAGLTQASPEEGIFGSKAEVTDGKSSLGGDVGSSPLCPNCGFAKVWRAGLRYSPFGDKIQRWLCRSCGLRFSDPQDVQKAWSTMERAERVERQSLKSGDNIVSNSQICVEEAKNLDPEQVNLQQVPEKLREIKGKLVQFAWRMQQEGYTQDTARVTNSCLRALISNGADLADPTSVKDVLAKGSWSPARKHNIISAYTLFLKFNDMSWTKPKCHVPQKFPFIPTEQEIDALIAASCKKHAALLTLLKETGMRVGEARRLEWTDIDSERNTITLNAPEKRSSPRMWRVTPRLIEMLKALPRKEKYVFTGKGRSMEATLKSIRKRLARDLQNPRFIQIHFHTLRHWKATMLYHQTKDPYYVQHFLGHRTLKSTEIYINIEHTLFEAGTNDQYTVKVAEKPDEIKQLLEAGFDYVCQKGELAFMRKRR